MVGGGWMGAPHVFSSFEMISAPVSAFLRPLPVALVVTHDQSCRTLSAFYLGNLFLERTVSLVSTLSLTGSLGRVLRGLQACFKVHSFYKS